MSNLDYEEYKVRGPVKKKLDGKAVFIKPDMSAMDDIAYRAELRTLDKDEEGFGECFVSLIVKHRVVFDDGKPVFDCAVKEMMAQYGEAFIGRLYEVVVGVIGDPFEEEDAAVKNS